MQTKSPMSQYQSQDNRYTQNSPTGTYDSTMVIPNLDINGIPKPVR